MRSRVLRSSIPVSALLLSFAFAASGQQWEDFKTNLAPTAPSPERAVDRMLEIAHLKPGETLYDLGCGDGRILIAAANQLSGALGGIQLARVQRQSIRAQRVSASNRNLAIGIHMVDGFRTNIAEKKSAIVGAYRPFGKNESFLNQLRLRTGRNDARNPSRCLRR